MKKRSRLLIGVLLIISCLLVGCEDFSDLLVEVEEIVFDNLQKESAESEYQETDNAIEDDYKIDMIEEEIGEDNLFSHVIDPEIIEPQMEGTQAQGYQVEGSQVEDSQVEDSQTQEMQNKGRQEFSYAYQLLSEELKPLYHEILQILEEQLEKIKINTTSIEDMDYVFRCVLNDRPELFYVEGYVYTKHTRKDEIKRIDFSGNYTMDKDERIVKQKEVEEIVSGILSEISLAEDDYAKVKYVYDYIGNHTEYNLEAKDNQNILSVFLYGESVCQGYAKAMQYLLTELGVESTLVIGTVNLGEGHAWNLVNVNDAYYYVDPTWGDASYVFESSDVGTNSKDMTINYDYLCVTTEQLLKTHQIKNVVSVPDCTETKDNYYVKENCFFDSMDNKKMETLFERAYESEAPSVTLKCKNQDVFREILKIMIEEQDIFNYLDYGNTEVSYTYNDQQLTISFWL